MGEAPRHADRLCGDGAGGGHVLVLAGDPGAGVVGCPKRPTSAKTGVTLASGIRVLAGDGNTPPRL